MAIKKDYASKQETSWCFAKPVGRKRQYRPIKWDTIGSKGHSQGLRPSSILTKMLCGDELIASPSVQMCSSSPRSSHEGLRDSVVIEGW